MKNNKNMATFLSKLNNLFKKNLMRQRKTNFRFEISTPKLVKKVTLGQKNQKKVEFC